MWATEPVPVALLEVFKADFGYFADGDLRKDGLDDPSDDFFLSFVHQLDEWAEEVEGHGLAGEEIVEEAILFDGLVLLFVGDSLFSVLESEGSAGCGSPCLCRGQLPHSTPSIFCVVSPHRYQRHAHIRHLRTQRPAFRRHQGCRPRRGRRCAKTGRSRGLDAKARFGVSIKQGVQRAALG